MTQIKAPEWLPLLIFVLANYGQDEAMKGGFVAMKNLPSIFGVRPLDINRVFHELDAFAPLLTQRNNRGNIYPKLDIHATEEDVEISVELPGVESDDVNISVSDNTLMISGEKTTEEERDDKDFYLVERSYGRFERSIPLNFRPDPEKISARFDNGVLVIKIKQSREDVAKTHDIKITQSA